MMQKSTMIMNRKTTQSGVKNAPLFSKNETKIISQRATRVLGIFP